MRAKESLTLDTRMSVPWQETQDPGTGVEMGLIFSLLNPQCGEGLGASTTTETCLNTRTM